MASVIGRRKSREDGSVKQKNLADDVRLLGKIFSRETLVTTNHCISSLICWRAIGYRLGRGKIAGCPHFRMSNWNDQENFAKLEAMTCLIYLLPLQDLNQIVKALFFGAKRPLTPKSHQPDTKMLLKPLRGGSKTDHRKTILLDTSTSPLWVFKFPLNQVTGWLGERMVSSNPKSGFFSWQHSSHHIALCNLNVIHKKHTKAASC